MSGRGDTESQPTESQPTESQPTESLPTEPLAAERVGSGRRLVLVHGFTQTRAAWRPVARRFADAGYEVVLVDLPGHGASSDRDLDLWGTADALAAAGGRAVYVGYSLGGRVCLHLALRYPELVEAVVLVGATPGIDDADERAARRAADDALAERLGTIGVEAFLDEWLAQPLFASLRPNAEDLAARRANTAHGLATSLRRAGTGTQESLWGRLGEIDAPVLTVVGADDAKFAAIAERMRERLVRADGVALANCGHAAHLEQSDEFFDVVSRWLGRRAPDASSAQRHPERGE